VKVFMTVLGCVGLLSVIYALWVLSRLSEKLGAVTKMPPFYRGFYVAISLFSLAVASDLIKASVQAGSEQIPPFLSADVFYLAAFYLPLLLGSVIALAITWRYWGLLIKERTL